MNAMMDDYRVPMWGVFAAIAWLNAFALMIAGWVVLVHDRPNTGIMLGLTAVLVAAVAVSLTSNLLAGAILMRLQQERSRPQSSRS